MIGWLIESKKVICKIKSKLQEKAATKETGKTSSAGRGNSAKALGQKQRWYIGENVTMTGNVMRAPGRVVSCVIKELSMQGSVNQS